MGEGDLRRLILLISLLLVGCASSEFTQSGARAYRPYSGEVAVLGQLPPGGGYERVGVVVVSGVEYTPERVMRTQAIEEAAERGANAVVFQGPVRIVGYRGSKPIRKLAAWAIRVRR